jgi:hypothetical protein
MCYSVRIELHHCFSQFPEDHGHDSTRTLRCPLALSEGMSCNIFLAQEQISQEVCLECEWWQDKKPVNGRFYEWSYLKEEMPVVKENVFKRLSK